MVTRLHFRPSDSQSSSARSFHSGLCWNATSRKNPAPSFLSKIAPSSVGFPGSFFFPPRNLSLPGIILFLYSLYPPRRMHAPQVFKSCIFFMATSLWLELGQAHSRSPASIRPHEYVRGCESLLQAERCCGAEKCRAGWYGCIWASELSSSPPMPSGPHVPLALSFPWWEDRAPSCWLLCLTRTAKLASTIQLGWTLWYCRPPSAPQKQRQ